MNRTEQQHTNITTHESEPNSNTQTSQHTNQNRTATHKHHNTRIRTHPSSSTKTNPNQTSHNRTIPQNAATVPRTTFSNQNSKEEEERGSFFLKKFEPFFVDLGFIVVFLGI